MYQAANSAPISTTYLRYDLQYSLPARASGRSSCSVTPSQNWAYYASRKGYNGIGTRFLWWYEFHHFLVYNIKLKVIGIPFAEPPLGNLRLQPPVLKTQLDVSTFDASNFGPGCLQLVSRFMVPFHFLQVLMCIGSYAGCFRGLFNHQCV